MASGFVAGFFRGFFQHGDVNPLLIESVNRYAVSGYEKVRVCHFSARAILYK